MDKVSRTLVGHVASANGHPPLSNAGHERRACWTMPPMEALFSWCCCCCSADDDAVDCSSSSKTTAYGQEPFCVVLLLFFSVAAVVMVVMVVLLLVGIDVLSLSRVEWVCCWDCKKLGLIGLIGLMMMPVIVACPLSLFALPRSTALLVRVLARCVARNHDGNRPFPTMTNQCTRISCSFVWNMVSQN